MSSYIMNERLRFSWGHIIAFIALIMVSYLSFVGYTYLSGGNFIFGVCAMGVTDVVFLLVFIGAQQLKASGEKMSKKIVLERILVYGSPVVFIVGMVGMSHVWTVRSHDDEIMEHFNNAIRSGEQIFEDYEGYASSRIALYDKTLDYVLSNKTTNPSMYREAGFTGKLDGIRKENMLEVLRLKLQPPDYETLKRTATKWMAQAKDGGSTYNVFLLGNAREIRDAVVSWDRQLKHFAGEPVSNENFMESVVAFDTEATHNATMELDSVTQTFTQQKFPTLWAIGFGVLLYLMLLLPYLIQERHSKSIYTLRSKDKDNDFPTF